MPKGPDVLLGGDRGVVGQGIYDLGIGAGIQEFGGFKLGLEFWGYSQSMRCKSHGSGRIRMRKFVSRLLG